MSFKGETEGTFLGWVFPRTEGLIGIDPTVGDACVKVDEATIWGRRRGVRSLFLAE
jgi:hypothetical protein